MTNGLRFLAALTWLAATPTAVAQIDVGEGGDTVFCRDEGAGEFRGWYFLDYVATWDSVAGRDAFHDDADPVEKIITILNDRIPALGMDLREFVDDARRQLARSSDPTSRNIWMRTSNGILTLHDEELRSLPESFPPNCFDVPAPGHEKTLNLHQVVIHQERDDAHVFKYDPTYAARITGDPVQASMLFVHEWLWRFSPNATVTRDVNRYLHTKDVERTTGASLKRALGNLGLDLSDVPPPRVTLRLETSDVGSIEPRRYPFDPDFGVDLVISNDVEGYFIVNISSDSGSGFGIAYLRPTSLGGPTEIRHRLSAGAGISVASCNPDTRQCGQPRSLLEIHEDR